LRRGGDSLHHSDGGRVPVHKRKKCTGKRRNWKRRGVLQLRSVIGGLPYRKKHKNRVYHYVVRRAGKQHPFKKVGIKENVGGEKRVQEVNPAPSGLISMIQKRTNQLSSTRPDACQKKRIFDSARRERIRTKEREEKEQEVPISGIGKEGKEGGKSKPTWSRSKSPPPGIERKTRSPRKKRKGRLIELRRRSRPRRTSRTISGLKEFVD